MADLTEKQRVALETIGNFILYWTSNVREQARMENAAWDYVTQDHVLTDEEEI